MKLSKFCHLFRNVINDGKLFSCFVDFRKAFDSVIHPGLQVKFKELNIYGKFYNILCSLYTKSSVCVRIREHHTDLFVLKVGVRQGYVLSPNLFEIFNIDMPSFLNGTPDPVLVNNLPLSCLMYADDIVLLSTTATGLQEKLNKLRYLCHDWCLDVNVTKTTILIFSKAGRLLDDKFYFDGNCLENVKHYSYLGVHFSICGVFNYAQDDIFSRIP